MLTLSPASVLQAENRAYGHAHTLSAYAGFERVRWVPGALQHGWNPYDGIGIFDGVWRSLPKFVWSEESARRGRERGGDGYHVIGAPWLYLLRHQRPTSERQDGAQSTIAVPFHATVHLRLVGDHADYARDLAEGESGRGLTVCLQWMDYDNRETRRVYEDIGARVITFGRGTSSAEGQATFLERQLEEFSRHDRLVSNRLATAVFYGAAAGLEVGVYGTDMSLLGQPAYHGSDITRRWPQLHGHVIESASAQEAWRDQLGDGHVLEPAELRDLMGWTRATAAKQLVFLGQRAVDLVRLNTRRTEGRRHFRVY